MKLTVAAAAVAAWGTGGSERENPPELWGRAFSLWPPSLLLWSQLDERCTHTHTHKERVNLRENLLKNL